MKYSPLRLLLPALCLLVGSSHSAPSSATTPRSVDHSPRATLERMIGHSLPATNASSALSPSSPGVDGAWSHLSIGDLYGHVAIYDPVRDRMLIFGGADNYGARTDVWSLSMTDPHPWTKLAPGGTPPASAWYQGTVYDPVRDRMVVVGSDDSNTVGVWTLSLSGPLQWTRLAPSGAAPGERGPAIYDPVRDRVVIANGGASIWTLSLSASPIWTEIATAGVSPTARFFPVAVYDSARDRMLFWGGDNDTFPLPTEVWALSLAGTPTWTQLPSVGNPPEGRFATVAIYDPVRDRMIVYAGSNFHPMSDAWSLSLSGTPAWSQINAATIPFAREFHTAVYDSMRRRMIVFSGAGFINGPPDRNDVWALSLQGPPEWTPVNGTSPEPRVDPSAIYDPVRDRMIVFGGYEWSYRTIPANEVWACSLGESPTWTELRTKGATPPDRRRAPVVYDPARDRMIMLGGSDSGGPLHDAWTLALKGTPVWNDLKAQGTPPPSIRTAVYDSHRDRVLVLTDPDNTVWSLSLDKKPQWSALNASAGEAIPGGSPAVYDAVRDRLLVYPHTIGNLVWALTLSGPLQWTPLAVAGVAPPEPGTDGSVIYDSLRDRLVLFRGHDADASPWALSLSGTPQWTMLVPGGFAPTTNDGHCAIYDPVRDRMIVFGGEYFYNEFNETFALNWGSAATIAGRTLTSSTPLGGALHDGYPNPFNPRVTIPFELTAGANVTLSIYDVSGRLVKTLIREWVPQGAHSIVWDGKSNAGEDVSSGIYFCRFSAGGFTQSRKLVMMK